VTLSTEKPLGHGAMLARLEDTAAAVAEQRAHRLAHAMLLAGPAGVGKYRSALWWSGRLKCSQRDTCAGETCRDCRQIAAGSHPDVTVLAPAAEGDALYIENVRDLIRLMSLRPIRPGPRIAIVRDAEALTPQAQSAMLKLLEEPPGFAVLILVSGNAAALLPTIRSRCQLLRFGLLEAEDVRRILEAHGQEPVLAARLARASGGRAGRAVALTPEGLADRDVILAAYEDIHAGRKSAIDELVLDLAARRKEGRPGLEALLEWQMRKVEASFVGSSTSEGIDAREAEAGEDEDPADLLQEAVRIAWAMRALDRNGNPKLVLRELLLGVRDR